MAQRPSQHQQPGFSKSALPSLFILRVTSSKSYATRTQGAASKQASASAAQFCESGQPKQAVLSDHCAASLRSVSPTIQDFGSQGPTLGPQLSARLRLGAPRLFCLFGYNWLPSRLCRVQEHMSCSCKSVSASGLAASQLPSPAYALVRFPAFCSQKHTFRRPPLGPRSLRCPFSHHQCIDAGWH